MVSAHQPSRMVGRKRLLDYLDTRIAYFEKYAGAVALATGEENALAQRVAIAVLRRTRLDVESDALGPLS